MFSNISTCGQSLILYLQLSVSVRHVYEALDTLTKSLRDYGVQYLDPVSELLLYILGLDMAFSSVYSLQTT